MTITNYHTCYPLHLLVLLINIIPEQNVLPLIWEPTCAPPHQNKSTLRQKQNNRKQKKKKKKILHKLTLNTEHNKSFSFSHIEILQHYCRIAQHRYPLTSIVHHQLSKPLWSIGQHKVFKVWMVDVWYT